MSTIKVYIERKTNGKIDLFHELDPHPDHYFLDRSEAWTGKYLSKITKFHNKKGDKVELCYLENLREKLLEVDSETAFG